MLTSEKLFWTVPCVDSLLLVNLLASQDQRLWQQPILHFGLAATAHDVTTPSIKTFPSFSCSMAPNFLTIDGLLHFLSIRTQGLWHFLTVVTGVSGMWSSVSGWVGVLRFQEEMRGGMGGAAVSISESTPGLVCFSLSGSALLAVRDLLRPLFTSQVLSGDKVIQFSLSKARRSSYIWLRSQGVSSTSSWVLSWPNSLSLSSGRHKDSDRFLNRIKQ